MREGLREGDIESLRNKMRDEGRPIKSTIVIDGNKRILYKVKKNGRVRIREELKD